MVFGTLSLKYISPFERQYESYNEHLIAFNRELQKKVSSDLFLLLKDYDRNIAIATVGSDARLEKGPDSQIELILLHDNISPFEEVQRILENYISTEDNKSLFFQELETKNVEGKKLYEYKLRTDDAGEVVLISPNRIFDMRILFEKGGLYRRLIQNFTSEIVLTYGKSLIERIKKKFLEHKGISISGIQNYKKDNLIHYNLDNGIANYSPKNNLWSFKQGPLRSVQYAIARDSINKIKRGGDFKEIFSLPKNTVEKLNRIEVESATSLSPSEVGDLTDCYKYFLHLYHQSHTTYRNRGSEQNQFDVVEVKERCRTLVNLCSKEIIKYH